MADGFYDDLIISCQKYILSAWHSLREAQLGKIFLEAGEARTRTAGHPNDIMQL